MKPLLKLTADQFFLLSSSGKFATATWLFVDFCYKRKNSWFSFYPYVYFYPVSLLNLSSIIGNVYVNIIQIITLCPVIRISEKFHLSHVFQYHFHVSDSQFCIRTKFSNRLGRTITHICPSLLETNHVQNQTPPSPLPILQLSLLLFSFYLFPRVYNWVVLLNSSISLLFIYHWFLSAAKFLLNSDILHL